MTDWQPGDVLARETATGTRYLRISPNTTENETHRYVRACDAAGFHLDNLGRYLTVQHLERNYRLHYRTEDHR